VSPLEELADQLEDHGWDSELIDAVKARMAQLEKVAELARQVVAMTDGPFNYVEDCRSLEQALVDLDQGTPYPDTKE
jgi:hypothetical protein